MNHDTIPCPPPGEDRDTLVVPMLHPITPSALRGRRSVAKKAFAHYYALRAAALAVPKSRICDREDAIGAALMARHDAYHCKRLYESALARPCIKGWKVSPNAKARAIASGRWRRDAEVTP